MAEQSESGTIQDDRAQSFHQAPRLVVLVTPPIELALGELGLHGKRRAMLDLFDRRITRGAVIHWRKGRRTTPAWAIKLAREAIAAKRRALDHVDSLLLAQLERRRAP